MNRRQLHKRFSAEQVQALLAKYKSGLIKAKETYTYLGVGKSRFYELVALYEKTPKDFTIAYKRTVPNNKLRGQAKQHILKELRFEKERKTNS